MRDRPDPARRDRDRERRPATAPGHAPAPAHCDRHGPLGEPDVLCRLCVAERNDDDTAGALHRVADELAELRAVAKRGAAALEMIADALEVHDVPPVRRRKTTAR